MIEIVLLGAPRGKERPRGTKDGHFYTPEKTRSYEAALKYAAGEVMGSRAPLDGPLDVDLRIVFPITASWPKRKQADARSGALRPTKKPDADNLMKTLDALNMVVWIDDAQIVRAVVEKHYGDRPGLWITIKPSTQQEGIFG
jgi:Holliday junction resolvase RusA-like endonuclease